MIDQLEMNERLKIWTGKLPAAPCESGHVFATRPDRRGTEGAERVLVVMNL
jgi:hypothetical protein